VKAAYGKRFEQSTGQRKGGIIKSMKILNWRCVFLCLFFFLLSACATTDIYRDPNMDFGSIQTIAVMPFANLARDNVAAERVRDVFMNKLLSTGGVYVLPIGEVARGVARAEIGNPGNPSTEEVIKLAGIIKAQAVITGAVREYGEVRSGTSSANIISLSLVMIEAQTGKVVWSGSSTKGGITVWDRLFGGGGQPMNKITERAVDDLVNKLFK
jgi:polysaccharide biosynthesis protein PelC